MLAERTGHSGGRGIESLVALAITIGCVLPLRNLTLLSHYVSSAQIRVSDALVAILFPLVWGHLFSALKVYDVSSPRSSRFIAASKGVLLMLAITGIYLIAVRVPRADWHHLLLLAPALLCFEFLSIVVVEHLKERLAARDPLRIVILGSGPRASRAWRSIRTSFHRSVSFLGFVDDRAPEHMAPEVAQRLLGTIDQLNEFLLKDIVDAIVIAMPTKSCYTLMQRAIHIAEQTGVPVVYLGDIYSSQSRRNRGLGHRPFLELAPLQDGHLRRLSVKRLVDFFGAAVGLLCLSPLLLCIALAVKLTSKGPVLFRQQRYGYRRRVFRILKFRTMIDNAEKHLSELEHLNEAQGPIFKMRDDPRVTKLGKLLRRTSFDELPQLWNVLVGEMSLVGPRPMSVRDVALFGDAMLMRRFSVKPGMTGLWQVSGRSNLGFDQWFVLDSTYIDAWTLSLDFKILLRTFGVVIGRSGAM